MKPRVLIYRSDLLPPSETFIAAQAGALQRYDPQFVGLRAVQPSLLADTAVILPRCLPRLERLLALERGVAPALLRRARLAGGALVHAHFALDGAEVLPLVRTLGLPLLVTLHGYDVMCAHQAHVASRRGRRYIERRAQLWEYAAAFLCVSEAIRRAAVLRGFPEQKLRVLPIGIDATGWTPASALPASPTVLFIGRLVPKKGVDTLIPAMRLVQRQLPEARLIVAGDGPERARLEALARVQAPGTRFLGRQTPQQVCTLLAESRCLAAPSRTASDGDSEGLPTVLLEAMAAGVPVAATVHSGIPELVTHGECGLLCPEGNVEMLARNLVRLLSDDPLAARLAFTGRARVERDFALTTHTRRLEEVYDEIADRAGSGARVERHRVSANRPAGADTVPHIAARESAPAQAAVATRPQRLRTQAAWLLSGNGASMLAQAVAFVLVGHMLGAREYGALVGAVALISVLSQFSSLGMEMVLLRTVARRPEAFAATWFRALTISGIGFLVLLGVVMVYGRLFLPPPVRMLLPWLAAADALFGKTTQLGSRALQGAGLARWSAKLLAATNLARCGAAGALVLSTRTSRGPVLLDQWVHWYTAASALVAIFSVCVVTRLLGRPARAAVRGRDLLEGLSFSFSNSAISIYNDIDKTVLLQYGMFSAAGIYGAAYRVVDVACAPIVSLFAAASPGLFRDGGEGGVPVARAHARRLLRWAAPGGLALACVLALGAPVVPHLFGRSFAGSVHVLRWLCLLPLLRALHYAWGTAITACASQWLRTAAQVAVALLNLGLNLWLVPRWGWHASAVISLGSDGTLALASLLILHGLGAQHGPVTAKKRSLAAGSSAA